MDAFIQALLERLQATSLQTALLATIVWALCRLAPRLSPATQCWLWWVVALQALAGLIASPVHLPWLPPATAQVLSMPVPATLDTTAANPHTPSAAMASGFTWQTILFVIWFCGFLIAVASTLREWRRARSLRRASIPCPDDTLLALAQTAAACGLRNPPALRLSHDIDSPLLLGRVHPMLLLPARISLSRGELDMTLMHELIHLRRRDLWWGCIPSIARQLFFFHPLVHVAVREYGIAREAACDAAVVETDQCSRQAYGRLLLRLGTSAAPALSLAMASPTFVALRKRLTLLQQGSYLPRTASVALVLLVAVAGVMPLRLVAGAAPVQIPPPAPVQAEPSSRVPNDIPPSPQSTAMPAPFSPADTTAPDTQAADPRPPSAPDPAAAVRFSAKMEEIPVRTLLELIANVAGKNIVIDESVSGSATLRFENIPWDQALDLVLRMKNLEKRMQGETILVVPAAAPDAGAATVTGAASGTPEESRRFLEIQLAEFVARMKEVERLQKESRARQVSEQVMLAEIQQERLAQLEREFEVLKRQYEERRSTNLETAEHHASDAARLRTALELARSEYGKLLERFNEKHPEVIAQRQRLEQLQLQLDN